MIGWRLCRQVHANLTGEGAQRYGGRWNSPGHPMVYLAEHPALAMLEVRVNLDLPFDLIPNDYVLLRVDVPDSLSIISRDALAAGEKDDACSTTPKQASVAQATKACLGDGVAPRPDTVATGDAWLSGLRSATLRVASVLVPHAWNILLNPRHPEAASAAIAATEPFRFDPRLWQPLGHEG